jgi:hypothetical protein
MEDAMTTEIINSLSPELPPATTDAVNANDVHRFVYTWFTMFEHRAPAGRLTRHLAADRPIRLSFPGTEPLRDAEQFAEWYGQLLANTVWNFHELTNVTVRPQGDGAYQVGFDVDWQGASPKTPRGRRTFPNADSVSRCASSGASSHARETRSKTR